MDTVIRSSASDAAMPWIGNIPQRWDIRRAKWLFTKMERPVRVDDEVVTCFRDGVVTLRKNRRTSGFTESLKEIGYQGIRKGDLVIHAMDGFAGAIGVSDSDGKGTPVYSVCRPLPVANAEFYAYMLREMARSGWIHALAKGIRERSTDFRYSSFSEQNLPLPPIPEQRAIARYLDYMDRRIQRYIEAKERLIELLEEQKRVVINQAVTRGLDPDVPLKPSGVEWLGDVPAHWQFRRLKFLSTKFGSGVTPRGGAAVYVEPGIPFLRSQNVHFDGLRLEGVARIDPMLHQQMASSHVLAGDVLLNITGASIGRACAVPDDFKGANVNQHVCIVRPKDELISSEYLAAFLATQYIQRQIRLELGGASREGLTLDSICSFAILLPPRAEQDRLVDYVSKAVATASQGSRQIRRQIELIKEYRTRLIADVVTGKLDVRDAAAGLPDD